MLILDFTYTRRWNFPNFSTAPKKANKKLLPDIACDFATRILETGNLLLQGASDGTTICLQCFSANVGEFYGRLIELLCKARLPLTSCDFSTAMIVMIWIELFLLQAAQRKEFEIFLATRKMTFYSDLSRATGKRIESIITEYFAKTAATSVC